MISNNHKQCPKIKQHQTISECVVDHGAHPSRGDALKEVLKSAMGNSCLAPRSLSTPLSWHQGLISHSQCCSKRVCVSTLNRAKLYNGAQEHAMTSKSSKNNWNTRIDDVGSPPSPLLLDLTASRSSHSCHAIMAFKWQAERSLTSQ